LTTNLISYAMELIFYVMSMLSLVSIVTLDNTAAIVEHEIYLENESNPMAKF
jgi:hypothetical protein